jgi:hypothetical protein
VRSSIHALRGRAPRITTGKRPGLLRCSGNTSERLKVALRPTSWPRALSSDACIGQLDNLVIG